MKFVAFRVYIKHGIKCFIDCFYPRQRIIQSQPKKTKKRGT